MVHGRVEFEVQKRLSAVPIIQRFVEHLEGQDSLARLEVPNHNAPAAAADRMAAQRWGFNMFRRYRGDQRLNRRMLNGSEMISVSNAIYILSKLFSGAGDHKRYFLNEFDLLKVFIEEAGAKHSDKIPAFKGSRMH